MLSQIKKISSSKLNTQPFPYIFIKDLFDENYVKKLNKLLPSYQNLKGDDIMFQSKSGQKKLSFQVRLSIKL